MYVVSQNQHFILPSDESMLLGGFGAKRPYYKCTKRRWWLTGRRVSAAGTRPSQELLDERKWAEGINKERRRVMEEDHSSVVQTTRIYSCKVWIRMKFCSFDDKVELLEMTCQSWFPSCYRLCCYSRTVESCSTYTLMKQWLQTQIDYANTTLLQ